MEMGYLMVSTSEWAHLYFELDVSVCDAMPSNLAVRTGGSQNCGPCGLVLRELRGRTHVPRTAPWSSEEPW
jgi:hypothetical protein